MKQYQSPVLEIRVFQISDMLMYSDPQTPIEPWSFRVTKVTEQKVDVFTK